ncbi:hypothetical protein [Shewanella phaeophyticola]|uniref:Replication initiation factor n=1 Tax=Shewanella phaeophyticola TaxID=2978345 RepID=A0ABT2P0T9_9GAMM|nr:hypothetical protein [Shewanella sp. KJ10-1]MCT8985280.1 hypothetical protein [Shewanella sp. KJ10-1]
MSKLIFNILNAILFDKLVIVMRCLDDVCKHDIANNVVEIAKSIAKHHQLAYAQVLKPSGGYRYCIKLPLLETIDWARPQNGVPHLFIQVHPYAESRPFIRLSFNGFPLKRKHFFIARLWLEHIFSDHGLLASDNMKVTAIDIAHDLAIDINELSFNLASSQTSMIAFAKNGGIGSYYVGNRKAKFRFVAYDRTANCKAKKLPTTGEQETRLEAQLKPNCTLHELSAFLSPCDYLKRIEVYDLNALKSLTNIHPHTIMAITAYGLKPALQSLPKDERRKMKRYIEQCKLLPLCSEAVKEAVNKELCNVKGLMMEHSNKTSKECKPYKLRAEFNKLYSMLIENVNK